jgi:hypothetical protein
MIVCLGVLQFEVWNGMVLKHLLKSYQETKLRRCWERLLLRCVKRKKEYSEMLLVVRVWMYYCVLLSFVEHECPKEKEEKKGNDLLVLVVWKDVLKCVIEVMGLALPYVEMELVKNVCQGWWREIHLCWVMLRRNCEVKLEETYEERNGEGRCAKVVS